MTSKCACAPPAQNAASANAPSTHDTTSVTYSVPNTNNSTTAAAEEPLSCDSSSLTSRVSETRLPHTEPSAALHAERAAKPWITNPTLYVHVPGAYVNQLRAVSAHVLAALKYPATTLMSDPNHPIASWGYGDDFLSIQLRNKDDQAALARRPLVLNGNKFPWATSDGVMTPVMFMGTPNHITDEHITAAMHQKGFTLTNVTSIPSIDSVHIGDWSGLLYVPIGEDIPTSVKLNDAEQECRILSACSRARCLQCGHIAADKAKCFKLSPAARALGIPLLPMTTSEPYAIPVAKLQPAHTAQTPIAHIEACTLPLTPPVVHNSTDNADLVDTTGKNSEPAVTLPVTEALSAATHAPAGSAKKTFVSPGFTKKAPANVKSAPTPANVATAPTLHNVAKAPVTAVMASTATRMAPATTMMAPELANAATTPVTTMADPTDPKVAPAPANVATVPVPSIATKASATVKTVPVSSNATVSADSGAKLACLAVTLPSNSISSGPVQAAQTLITRSEACTLPLTSPVVHNPMDYADAVNTAGEPFRHTVMLPVTEAPSAVSSILARNIKKASEYAWSCEEGFQLRWSYREGFHICQIHDGPENAKTDTAPTNAPTTPATMMTAPATTIMVAATTMTALASAKSAPDPAGSAKKASVSPETTKLAPAPTTVMASVNVKTVTVPTNVAGLAVPRTNSALPAAALPMTAAPTGFAATTVALQSSLIASQPPT